MPLRAYPRPLARVAVTYTIESIGSGFALIYMGEAGVYIWFRAPYI